LEVTSIVETVWRKREREEIVYGLFLESGRCYFYRKSVIEDVTGQNPKYV